MAKTKMMAVHVPKPGADFEVVERDIPEPGPGQVRIRVQACGVCHSDAMTKEGLFPGISYPRVPGHEVAGVVDGVGTGVQGWKKGERVGVGWHGGQDNTCRECRGGDFCNCQNLKIAGISYDGGYQQYMIAPVEALVRIPHSLSDVEAAPLLCAGITTYNALRHSGAFPGDIVAVQGIGGLGHLGIQWANKFGYNVGIGADYKVTPMVGVGLYALPPRQQQPGSGSAPGAAVAQGFCLDREAVLLRSGKRRHERVYGITSLTPEQAGPGDLLAYTRAHWGIENRSHYGRDVTLGEDASRRHGNFYGREACQRTAAA